MTAKKDNAMSLSKLLPLVGFVSALTGCHENPLVPKPNQIPMAVAEVIGPDGNTVFDPVPPTCPGDKKPVPSPAHMIKLPYDGTDVSFQLDGSHSTDGDGHVAKYQWLSAASVPDGGEGILSHDMEVTVPDAGTMTVHVKAGGRYAPSGSDPGWPDDKPKVPLSLGPGLWGFTLFVTDDRGAISTPDSVTISIGGDPRVKTCMDGVLKADTISDDCKSCICSQSDTCRMNVVETACDATCWGLIQCIATMCPDFAKMSMQSPPDFSCVTGKCSAFLAGAMAATAAGMCVTPCAMDCGGSTLHCDGGMPSTSGTTKADAGL